MRNHQVASRNRYPDRRGQGRRQSRGRSIRLTGSAPLEEDSDIAGIWWIGGNDAAISSIEGNGRKDSLCHYRRRHEVFLNGALFVVRPDSMSLVATDGHRLALVTVPRNGSEQDDVAHHKAGKQGEKSVQSCPRRRRTWAPARGRGRRCPLPTGREPPVFRYRRTDVDFARDRRSSSWRERVIPKANDKHIEFERDRLTNAVKRVALLSNERSRAVKFLIDKGKVDVTSSGPDLGEAHETLPEDYSGGAMRSVSMLNTSSTFSRLSAPMSCRSI